MSSLERIKQLRDLPQELCNMCGKCCKITAFKDALSYEEVVKLSQSTEEDEFQVRGARDFLSIFIPYNSAEEARKIAPEFVDRIYEKFGKDSKVSFFFCKFLSEQNHCLIYEDRLFLCRIYPIPNESTYYVPGCGFEEQGKKNWQEIKEILNDLEQQKNALQQERDFIEQQKEAIEQEKKFLLNKLHEINEQTNPFNLFKF